MDKKLPEIKILTKNPHSEDDIILDKPIKIKIYKLTCTMDMLCQRDLLNWEMGCKQMGMEIFATSGLKLPEEHTEGLDSIYEDSPLIKMFDPGLGMPWLLCKFIKMTSISKTILTAWLEENRIFIAGIDESAWQRRLAEYIVRNFRITEIFKLFNQLVALQSQIKKKALLALMDRTGFIAINQGSQPSPTMLASSALIQRKRRLKLVS